MLSGRCDLQPQKAAHWWHPKQYLRLSGGAAVILEQAGLLKMEDLECLRKSTPRAIVITTLMLGAKEYEPRWRAPNPVDGGATDLLAAVVTQYSGLSTVMTDPVGQLSGFPPVTPEQEG